MDSTGGDGSCFYFGKLGLSWFTMDNFDISIAICCVPSSHKLHFELKTQSKTNWTRWITCVSYLNWWLWTCFYHSRIEWNTLDHTHFGLGSWVLEHGRAVILRYWQLVSVFHYTFIDEDDSAKLDSTISIVGTFLIAAPKHNEHTNQYCAITIHSPNPNRDRRLSHS